MKDGVRWSKGQSTSMKHTKLGDAHKQQGKISKSERCHGCGSVQAHTQQGQGGRKAALPKLTLQPHRPAEPMETITANRREFWVSICQPGHREITLHVERKYPSFSIQ